MTAAKLTGVAQVMGEMDPDELENGNGEPNNGNSDATHNIGSLTGWQAIAAGVRCLVHCSRCVHVSSESASVAICLFAVCFGECLHIALAQPGWMDSEQPHRTANF